MPDLTLPAFEMDCREWLVLGADGAAVPDSGEASDAPLLAILSSPVIDVGLEGDIAEATGTLTVGLLDDDEIPALALRQVVPGAAALQLLDASVDPAVHRYVMPAPGAHRLAILAEFTVPAQARAELERRVRALMASFRWQPV